MFPGTEHHSWQDWLKVINELPAADILISGGEPLLLPGIISFMDNLATKHLISITTNLSQLPHELLSFRRRKELGVCASFHPDMADRDEFAGKIRTLIKHGLAPYVQCVAHPSLFDQLPELKTFFTRQVKVRLVIDPHTSPDFRYSESEKDVLRKLGLKKDGFGFDFEDGHILKRCYAGVKHFVIVPNGDVYACHAGFYYSNSALHKKFAVPREKFLLGNLFAGSFQPRTGQQECSLPCSEACDLYGARVKKIKKLFYAPLGNSR